jgi:hypothetical protein
VAVSETTLHLSKEKLLRAIWDESVLTDEEMQHLLDCVDCLALLGDLDVPDD